MLFLPRWLLFVLTIFVCFSIKITHHFYPTQIAPVFAQEIPIVAQIPTVNLSDLPQEAETTLQLIDQGGPFPYPGKDGSIFSNREKLLPRKPRGYYREYTIPTPRARNRGARRFVIGNQGEVYYTENHYQSFFRVLRQ